MLSLVAVHLLERQKVAQIRVVVWQYIPASTKRQIPEELGPAIECWLIADFAELLTGHPCPHLGAELV